MMRLHTLSLLTLLLPLLGSVMVALGGRQWGRLYTNFVALACMIVATITAALIFTNINLSNGDSFEISLYRWLSFQDVSRYQFEMGFLIDALSSTMMLVVCSVSLVIHIYTIGYMDHDENYEKGNPYYHRFFSYISLFTFAMLALVMSNNFVQLFFGWEAVGLISYLLIGFYTKRESASRANLKAFLVNRVGDFGFLLGIALIFMYFDTLNYQELFKVIDDNPNVQSMTVSILPFTADFAQWQVVTLISVCLFVGAMGKSAQMPLHVWLPESMEGPTPVSALIHAATMVTAGIFMIVRLHPLFILSEAALSMIIIVGSTTAFMMGLLGIVQNDIKRVVAYSTLSQLGYMVAALGASAFIAGFFHVFTHAFFKALLFLGAGSVIVAMHHVQDIQKMGGLRKYMPITWWCMLLGSLALIGFPGFSGFFSKDIIINEVGNANVFGSTYAYVLLLLSVFVTALYSFRLFFLVFHGEASNEVRKYKPAENLKSITFSLIFLAVPSVIIGWLVVDSWIFGDFFASVTVNLSDRASLLLEDYESGWQLFLHVPMSLPSYLAVSGLFVAWYLYCKRPDLPPLIAQRYQFVYRVMRQSYGFDQFNQKLFVNGSIRLGGLLWNKIDRAVFDDGMVGSMVRAVQNLAVQVRGLQTGFIYHYAFMIIIGLMFLLAWIIYSTGH